MQYRGMASSESSVQGSLEDLLAMGNLMPDVKVKDVMDTQTEPLCYSY